MDGGDSSMTRVLLIDDDAELRAALSEALRDAGFDVTEASDGEQGVQMQRSNPADVIVSDIFMPGQEGIETIFKLRSIYPTLKIIAMSGGTPNGGRYNYLPVARDLGADRCLQKPFTIARLISTVRELLEPRASDGSEQRSSKSPAG